MSRISVEWIDEHRREVVTGSAIIIIFFLAVFWWYIFSTASTGPLQMSAISGVVFIDDDVDGVFSPDDEFGFPAVAIQLYDSSGLLTSEVTDDEGTFIFSGLDPGEYTVREILPNDWEATSERELDVNVAQGETLFLSFGLAEIEEGPIPVVLTYGTLSGTVYDDDNNNGEFDGLEIGVENVQVKLSNSLGDVAELLTDSEGKYLFENLRTGEYRLNEVVPQGWYNTTDSNVKVVVTSEQETVTDFGIGKVTEGDGDDEETGPSSTITVQVFRDNNENKVHDSSEGGILGVAISLMEGEELVDKQSTNSKGRVFFEVNKAGTYTVMEEDLPSYTSTTPNEVEVEVVLETDYEVFFGDFRRGGPPPPPPPSTSTIVGTVFYDADYDGSVDPGEDGIPGVTVSLERGGSPYRSDVTDSNGQVSFSSLSDGSYQLIETDPEGYLSTTSNTLSFSVTSGTYTGIFGDAEYGSLYGYAFDDADGNGIFDEGEEGLSGVTVKLNNDGGEVDQFITGEDGLYSFSELMPGVYEVTSAPVEGYFRITPDSVQVELGPGDEKRVDFGYAPDDSEFGSVYGTVFNDKDGSIDRSLGELGLEGVEITLTLVDDGSESTTTDEFGVYTFMITKGGDYNIHEEDPDGWFSTTSNDLLVEDAVLSSSNGSPHDFGDTLGATVSGMVYDDMNRDGVKDSEETGVEGVLVELFLVEDLIDDTLTDVDGLYSFQILKSGDYHIEETDLIGWMSKTANTLPFTVGELTGQPIVDKDFGDYELAKGRISGTVFNDVDGSSDQGTGEAGIPDVVITLYDEDGEEVDQVQTDENGNYEFNDLIPGGYEVVETDPVGYRSITSNEVAVLVEEGDDDVVDFGDKEDGDWSSIYGTVWDDLNGNSKREVEFGIPGVTVSLYEDVPEGNDILLDTKITDLFGRYSFSVDEAGKYRVVETDPETYISTTDNDVPVTVILGDSYQVDFGDTIPKPSLSIVKKVLDPITDTPKDSVTVVDGTEVEYKFTVTNDGNVPLTNLVVEDDVLGTISMSETSLGLGESAEGTASHTVNGDVDNIADATALYDGDEISDQDTASVTVGSLGIKVIKDVSDDESSWSNHVDVYNGYSVYYSFTVENTGDVTLYSVSLSDDSLGAITLLKTTLEPGDTTTNAGTVSTTAVEGTHTNTASASGWYLSFEATYTDTASYTATPEPAKIFGKVFFDQNENGYIDPGDYGICCTTINLYKDNVFYDSDFTDLDGDYEFTDLIPGNYKVEEIERIPNTRDSTTDPVEETLSEGEAAEIDFGDYSDEGEVYGTVFLDRDGDGVKDSEDRGISGVTIKLMDGETEVDSTTTDKDGEYEFFVLSGSYTVKEIDPGWVDDSTTSNEVPVTVVNLGHHKADFGDTVEGGIDIYVFNDEDRDEWSDSSEDGIPDVEIEVHDDDGYIDSHYTWSSGWVWIDLLPGTYTIEEIDPEGYFSTTTNSHKITVLSDSWWDWEEFGDAQYQEDIRIDKQVKGRDGYWYNYSAPVGIGEYVEYKFIIKNIGPDPVSDLTVTDTVLGTLDFMPSALTAGEKVTKTYTSTTTSVKGHHSNTVRVYYDGLSIASDLACYQASDPSSIYGMVFYDDNQDGDYDSPSDYPLKNVYIELYKNGVYSRKDITDTNGEYSFEDLDPAKYKVKEIDTIFDCFDSTPDEVEYRLKSGEDKEINFGDYSNRGILMGVVYLDKDKDGELDTIPDDRPISGVTIKLWQGTELVDSTTTNGDGEYSFDVNAGTYKVEEINPTTPPNLYSVTQDIFEGVVIARCDYTYRDFLDATDDAGVDVLVFNDIDRDKYFDDYAGSSPEHGLGGVTIMVKDLYDNEDYYTTESDGYVFIPLTEGKYSIHETDPSDYFSTTPNVVNVELDVDEQEDVEFGDAEDDPRATIDLEVQDGNGDWHDTTIAHVMANSPINLRYTLKNTAVHAQHSVTVYDDWYGTVATYGTLQPDESVTEYYTDTYGLPPDDWSRSVIVYSQESDGSWMNGDTVKQFAEAPEIMSYKDVKGVEPWYDYDFAHAVTGEKVYFKYTVVNQGNIKFTNIKVEDNILGTIDMPDTTIYPGDYTEKIVEITASDGQVINRATVTGDTILTTVSHWNEAEYYGYEPDVKITKSVSANPGGPWENSIDIPVGDTVYYQYIIENTGDVDLENIVVEDSDFGIISVAHSSLGPGGKTGAISEISKTAVAGTDTNTATVTAEWHAIEDPPGTWYGKTVSIDDDASYFGVDDDVTLVKEIKGSSTGWVDDRIVVPTGDDVQYQFTVTNDGNTALTNIAVTDDTLTDPITFPDGQTSLIVGESMTSHTITVDDVDPGIVTNEAKVTADGELGSVEDTDTATYSAGKPEIEVKKEVSSDEIDWKEYVYVEWHMLSPDKVYFRYTVTNTGDVPLTDIQLEDDVLGSIDVPAGTYPPGQIGIFYAEHDAGYDEQRNIATVYGTWANDVVEDGDDASYFGVQLDTDIMKEVKVPDGDWTTAPDFVPLYVETGTIVEYRFIARNTGNTPVDITVEDTVFGTVTMSPTTVPNGDNSYSTDKLTHTTTTGTNYNEVTITSTYEGLEYEWKDSATVIAYKPDIEVVKQVSTDQSTWLNHVDVPAGDTVYYLFTVTNTGDVELTDVTLSDTHFGVLLDQITLPIGPTTVEKSVSASPDQQDNTASVEGFWRGIMVSDDDTASYFGEAPEITITKEVKGYDGIYVDDKTYAKTDDDVYFKLTVENTGNVELTSATINDPQLPAPILIGTMSPGDTYDTEYDITAVADEHENTAEVTSQYNLEEISDTDSATYEAGTPETSVTKEVSKDDAEWLEKVHVYVDDTVYYRFTLENTGDVPLTNVELTDSHFGLIIDSLTLQPNDPPIYYYRQVDDALIDEHENTASVSGEWYGIPAFDDDTAEYFGMNPQITVDKKVWGPITGAWYDTTVAIPLNEFPKFQYTVTNTGNVDLTNIEVKDNVLGDILNIATELAVGASDDEEVTQPTEAKEGSNTNTLTVTAMHDQKQVGPVTDQASYYGGTPGVMIEKQVSTDDATYHEEIIVNEGIDVYYKFTVTNTGTTPIQIFAVEDDYLGTIIFTQTSLDIGAQTTEIIIIPAAGGKITNPAIVSATSYDATVEDSDSATCIGLTGEAFIMGGVFEDENLNGVLDDGELGVEGVDVDLSGPSSDSATTGPDGSYSFTVTQEGTYTVTEYDLSGWWSTTDNEVDVTVDANELYGKEFTVDFGDAEGCYEDHLYYLAYEDECDNTFEDFGMTFDLTEIYLYGYLKEVQMEFTSRIYDSCYDHLIHIKRSINGASTVTVERTVPVYGDETPAGTYDNNGDVDIILYDTEKYGKPTKQMNEIVLVTIIIKDPLTNPKTVGTPPRQFHNEAAEPFYDLEPFWANYDPYEESNAYYPDWHINERIKTWIFGYGLYVPRILAIPYPDWIPSYTGTHIYEPYGYFDDYYRYGPIEVEGIQFKDWWTSNLVTNNAVEYGGLSWGPYSLP